MNVYIFENGNVRPLPNSQNWRKEHMINLLYLASDEHCHKFFSDTKPDVIVTCGAGTFSKLSELPLYIRSRWIHIENREEVTPSMITYCFKQASKKMLRPTISIFTTAFESGNRIVRAWKSLVEQTCVEWEWLIFDDSKTTHTWDQYLQDICEKDRRVRIFRSNKNNGYIGSTKHDIARMCSGDYLVEFDHDDELLPTALADLIQAFQSNPDVGMIGSDCIELYEGNHVPFCYGSYYGFGRHAYYNQWYEGQWMHVSRNGPLDKFTLRHIVGVLNHVRAWRRTCYDELNGHDSNLNVADDYDLILRTFISKGCSRVWRIGKLPIFLYKQYRTHNGSNFTILRNDYIQFLVAMLREIHEEGIHSRLLEFGEEKDDVYNQPVNPPRQNAYFNYHYDPTYDLMLDPNPHRISIIMPTFNREKLLIRAIRSVLAQTFQNWVLYIIGDKCPVLDHIMKRETWTHCNRIRYWNLLEKCGQGSFPRNYALKTLVSTEIVAYLDDDNAWMPNHLESLYTSLTTANNGATFAFSSFITDGLKILCSEPKLYRIDTSCLMHFTKLFKPYGYWRCDKTYGYAIDWDICKRWVEGGEPWVATKLFTLDYTNNLQNMDSIFNAYNDQPVTLEQAKMDAEIWLRDQQLSLKRNQRAKRAEKHKPKQLQQQFQQQQQLKENENVYNFMKSIFMMEKEQQQQITTEDDLQLKIDNEEKKYDDTKQTKEEKRKQKLENNLKLNEKNEFVFNDNIIKEKPVSIMMYPVKKTSYIVSYDETINAQTTTSKEIIDKTKNEQSVVVFFNDADNVD